MIKVERFVTFVQFLNAIWFWIVHYLSGEEILWLFSVWLEIISLSIIHIDSYLGMIVIGLNYSYLRIESK